MTSNYRNALRMIAAILLLGGAVAVAHADDDDDDGHGGGHRVAAGNPKWQAECGSCHVAFPPRLLPAASWRTMMSGLSDHFGTDASLDAQDAQEIGAFLEKHAGKTKLPPSAKPQLRITETRWFVREHDEVPQRVWKDARVKSAANCAACHTQAESGDYRERNIRVPR